MILKSSKKQKWTVYHNQIDLVMVLQLDHFHCKLTWGLRLRLFIVIVDPYRDYQSEGSPVPKVLQNSKKDFQMIRQNSDITHSNGKWNSQRGDHSAIKEEEPIVFKCQNSTLFHKVKNSKKIYDNFFVTGYSFEQNAPTIDYCYPSTSKHFEAILSLIYTDNTIRPL